MTSQHGERKQSFLMQNLSSLMQNLSFLTQSSSSSSQNDDIFDLTTGNVTVAVAASRTLRWTLRCPAHRLCRCSSAPMPVIFTNQAPACITVWPVRLPCVHILGGNKQFLFHVCLCFQGYSTGRVPSTRRPGFCA